MGALALANVKSALLQNPRRLDARQAAIRLLEKRHNCTAADAKKRLEALHGCHAFNEIFQAVMPDEYASELAKVGGSRIDVVKAFFPSLGFEVHEDVVIECLEGNSWFSGIPIPSLAYHACPNCFEFEGLSLPYQLAYLMARSTDSEFGTGSDCDGRDLADDQKYWDHLATKYKLPKTLQPCGVVDLNLLFEAFEGLTNPLIYVPDVFRTITYSTGSIFMDFDEDMGQPEIEWSAIAVRTLREEYQLAREIEERIGELNKWLEKNPTPRLSQALRLYAQTRKLTDEAKRKRPDEGRALIRIF